MSFALEQQESKYDLIASPSKEELGRLYTLIFEHVGYFTTPGKGLAAQGIDHILYRPDFSEPEIALRCRPDPHPVGVGSIRRFWNTIIARGYSRGIFATTRTFSPSAKEYCRHRELLPIDGRDLEWGLEDLAEEEREKIFKAFESSTSQDDASFSSRNIEPFFGSGQKKKKKSRKK